MVSTAAPALLVLLLALLLGAYVVVRVAKPFVVNAVVGLAVLLGASFLGLGLEITPMAVVLCVLGGVPGAILVGIMAYLDLAFAGTVTPLGPLTAGALPVA
jgi:hypothetical protein